MPVSQPESVTLLLRQAEEGDARALDRAFALVYDELRGLARWMRRGRPDATLSSTALVHEVYLKLVPGAGDAGSADVGSLVWRDRAHFFSLAARAMRQVLVDAARQQLAAKRGGGGPLVSLDEAAGAEPMRPEHLLALDEALARLAAVDARQARVVECRYFAGLTAEETAELLGVSEPTVRRDWRVARAWLAAELAEEGRG